MLFAVIDPQDIQKFTEAQATDPKLKKETERKTESYHQRKYQHIHEFDTKTEAG